jgi:photosystem II stability/assembly factor-like uncharacterized protein
MVAGRHVELHMRRIYSMEKTQSTIILLVLGILVLSGCDLTTNNHGGNASRLLGNNLVINEVFAVPPDKYYAFSWIELMNPTNRPLRWSSTATPAVGFAAGSGGTILVTKDGGSTWSTVSCPVSADLHSITFREPDSGYAVGANGTILRSTNKGASWVQQASGVTVDLNSVLTAHGGSITAGQNAWVCGDSGTILITLHNGASWVKPSTPPATRSSFHSIDGFTQTTGAMGILYACGDGGAVFASQSVGYQWSPVNANPNYDYYSVGTNEDSAWVAGAMGSAFVTRDEGGTFAMESTHVSGILRSLFVSKPDYETPPPFMTGEMWAVGDGAAIVKTTNSGTTWRKIDPGFVPTSNRLNSVCFVDSLRGWAFGDNGTIIYTVDGGESWSLQSSGTTANLYSAYFYPITSLHIVSYKYVLMMYAQRKHVYFDMFSNFTPGVNPNYDFITGIDTGYVFYDPTQTYLVGQDTIGPINPGGFVVVNSDSGKFQDHFNLGPGSTQVANISVGYYNDATGGGFVLWTLLPRGEIRLLKEFTGIVPRQTKTGDYYQLYDTTTTYTQEIDVVRYGNFKPDISQLQALARTFFYPGTPVKIGSYTTLYGTITYWWGTLQGGDYYSYKAPADSNNVAAGYIPEWWSLARYGNDFVVDPTTESAAQSFYLTNVPIPGWFSQKSR